MKSLIFCSIFAVSCSQSQTTELSINKSVAYYGEKKADFLKINDGTKWFYINETKTGPQVLSDLRPIAKKAGWKEQTYSNGLVSFRGTAEPRLRFLIQVFDKLSATKESEKFKPSAGCLIVVTERY